MIYPYDGVRASFEYYNNKIEYLEGQIKILKQEKEELLKLLEEQKVKKIGEKK